MAVGYVRGNPYAFSLSLLAFIRMSDSHRAGTHVFIMSFVAGDCALYVAGTIMVVK